MEPINLGRKESTPSHDLAWDEAEGAALACLARPNGPGEPVAENASYAEPPESLESRAGVRSLVEGYDRSTAVALTAREKAQEVALSDGAANTNAARTTERTTASAYVSAGETRSGDYFAGVATLKTHDARSRIDVEVFTASGQLGAQSEIQAGFARVGYSTAPDGVVFAVSVDTFTARANMGIRNDDGSEGGNLGASATAVGIEGTLAYSGWSLTAGAAVSGGGSFSSGDRDDDGDGQRERCFKGSLGFATLGVCTEF